MTQSRRGVIAFLICLVSSLCAAANVRVEGVTLVVNEVPVLAFRSEGGGQRVSSVATALQSLDGTEKVVVTKNRRDYSVMVGDVVIAGLSDEAAFRDIPSQKLAHEWAARLSYAFSLPPLRVTSSSVKLGVGAVQTIGIVGSMVPFSEIRAGNDAIVKARRTEGRVELMALKPGKTTVSISSGNATQDVGVEVQAWAATLPQTLELNVSGAPATSSTLKSAIAGVIQTQLVTADGANIAFKVPSLTDLGPGVTRTFTVPIRVSAVDNLQSTGTVNVVVHNLGLPQAKDDALWYSNNPESIVRPGALFSANLKLGAQVRLLYHHQNSSNTAMYLRVQAINDSDTPARLLIIPGDSNPDRNPVRAGLKAADQFVRAWMYGSGEVVTIPAHETLPISLRRILVGETVSGLCSIRLVSGPTDLQVRTDAWPPFQVDHLWESALWSSTPWRVVGTSPMNDYDRAPYEPSEHIYPDPYREDSVSYRVGGRFGVCRIGQKPISRQDDQQRLDGNFGVIYRIDAEISNPTAQTTDVEVVFEASAGYSGALFIVNGDYLVTPLLQPKDETRIARFHLKPGARQQFLITTLPVSGGSYPATITIRPVQFGATAAMR
jgi:hypothetical protein